ncbi:hypothetical protein IW262DRAFT_1300252 [Armillaria fumosa]|nr:hypothetical protein IW262DRAFT_1300252 [Armillaria fumosa]
MSLPILVPAALPVLPTSAPNSLSSSDVLQTVWHLSSYNHSLMDKRALFETRLVTEPPPMQFPDLGPPHPSGPGHARALSPDGDLECCDSLCSSDDKHQPPPPTSPLTSLPPSAIPPPLIFDQHITVEVSLLRVILLPYLIIMITFLFAVAYPSASTCGDDVLFASLQEELELLQKYDDSAKPQLLKISVICSLLNFRLSSTMDATSSHLLGNISMQDVLNALKDLQLLTQNLQEENHRLKTAAPPIPMTSLPSGMTSSESMSFVSQSSNSHDIGTTDIFANDPVLKVKLKSLLDSMDSQKELQYGVMKMVMFGHIWWERKHLFGVQCDLAIHELNATTFMNAIDSGITKPSPEHIIQLQLILLLYKHLPAAYHLLVGGSIMGE